MDIDNEQIFNREMAKIKSEFIQNIKNYKEFLDNSYKDAPIEILCLDKSTNSILKRHGIRRVKELTGLDLAKIKGLGSVRIGNITARLSQFLSC